MKHEKERILKLVEEGKLSAKESLILIEKLEEDSKETESKVTALSEDVIDSEDFYSEKKKEPKTSIGSKLFEWIDTAVKKVKEADLDLNFGHSSDV
ncbi:SHOCT-like domain-containing protein, partial [Bacillus licheniformis]|uniref:SHOCT-like domain-containing protein n=1 Tax=Bacillus licheniformis TaxID=1402 RepID=UPI003F6506CD